ncbi:MAG: glycosyltransferase, partial [Armatimonadota bacterium]
LEAAAAGMAIVSTNQRGPGEIIESERSGLLIPPGDGEALTHALRRVVADRNLRESLRKGAVARAREYTWSRTAQDLLRGYERAIAAAKPNATTPR